MNEVRQPDNGRSAELHSAVSQNFILQALRRLKNGPSVSTGSRLQIGDTAEFNSALPAIEAGVAGDSCDLSGAESAHTELLILPDGRILVHNLTAGFADLLKQLNPAEQQIIPRARNTQNPDP
jgi:hypothetical protein